MECMTPSKISTMAYIQANTRVIQCSLRKTYMHAQATTPQQNPGPTPDEDGVMIPPELRSIAMVHF